jgi:hypothetical protein
MKTLTFMMTFYVVAELMIKAEIKKLSNQQYLFNGLIRSGITNLNIKYAIIIPLKNINLFISID